ncbi:hypothetical protein AB0J83_25135 [Actinoplanes sp. NPDC049596]
MLRSADSRSDVSTVEETARLAGLPHDSGRGTVEALDPLKLARHSA